MAAPARIHWLVLDTTELSAEAAFMSRDDLGAAWLAIAHAAATGETPDLSDPAVADLWQFVEPRSRLDRRPNLPAATRALVFERDGLVCRYCEDEGGPFEIDHVVPVVAGGTDDPANLCVACETCNRSKGAKSLADWGGRAA